VGTKVGHHHRPASRAQLDSVGGAVVAAAARQHVGQLEGDRRRCRREAIVPGAAALRALDRALAGGHDPAPSRTLRRSCGLVVLGAVMAPPAWWRAGARRHVASLHAPARLGTSRHGRRPVRLWAAWRPAAIAASSATVTSSTTSTHRPDPAQSRSARRPPLPGAAVADPRAPGRRQLTSLGADPGARAAADLVLAGVQHHQEQPGHRLHLPGSGWAAREPRVLGGRETAGCRRLPETTTRRRHRTGQIAR
jgi:hypothetical protein